MSKKINSRQKGARYEREIARVLNDHGYTARRGQQFCGANGDPDVVAPDFPFHIESKRVERLDLYKAMTQAIADAKGKPPCVIHRKNDSESLFTCRLEDFLAILACCSCDKSGEGKGSSIFIPKETMRARAANPSDDQNSVSPDLKI